jgi:hypothetical protein
MGKPHFSQTPYVPFSSIRIARSTSSSPASVVARLDELLALPGFRIERRVSSIRNSSSRARINSSSTSRFYHSRRTLNQFDRSRTTGVGDE